MSDLSYLRKTLNILSEINMTDTYGDYSAETNLARANAVKQWIETNYGNIFECVITVSGSFTYTNIYYKGTNSGIFITQYASTSNSNATGYIYNDARTNVITGHYLYSGKVNLLIIKTRYGIIAGFYDSTISNYVKTAAIYNEGKLYPIILNTATASYIVNGTSTNTITLTARNTSGYAVLTRFAPPTLSFIPQGFYWSQAASIGNCGIYSINGYDGQFAELQGIAGYESIAMKLEEPREVDYTDIVGIWNTDESELE